MKKLIAFVLCVQLSFAAMAAAWTGSIATSYAGGNGSKENPFQIATPDQLALLGDTVNTKGKTYFGKFFVLTADLDLSNLPWSPIGGISATTTAPALMFKGALDGQNFKIMNLSYTSTSGYVGLFGYAKRATFKNLEIASGSVQGGFNVGALVGRADSTVIFNCKNAAAVKGTVPQGGATWVGGIAGNIGGVGTIIEYCSNSGAINGSGEHVGGVIGNVSVTNLSTNKCHIAYCSNSGAVTTFTKKAGGIVGTVGGVYCPIDQCFNTGKVSVVQDAVGGIVGYAYGDYPISNCYNTGEVAYSGTTNPAVFTAGILGYTSSTTPQRYFKSITNCYSNGVITGGCREVIVGQLNAGAPVGYGVVTNCFGLNRQLNPENAVNGGLLQWSANFKTAGFVTSLNSDATTPIWTIDANLNGGFPIFVWQTVAVPSAPTALSAVEIAKFANVYASNKTINVELKENETVAVSVYNLTGALIAQVKSTQSLTTVAVPQAGLYIVKVSDASRSFSTKVSVR